MVELLSSEVLGKLISLQGKLHARDGVLKLSNIRPDIYKVFVITALDRLFDIKKDEAAALAAFESI